MTNHLKTIELIRDRIGDSSVASIDELIDLIEPITIGLTQPMPVVEKAGRMFRVRTTSSKPTHMGTVGAPPNGSKNRGRINDKGTSVLYLSDTPYTAFEEAGITEGECCLSEWRVECDKLGLVNGGVTKELLAARFPKHPLGTDAPTPTELDEHVMELFREIFTLNVGEDVERYAWSIAAGRAGGFNHESGLINKVEKDGMTTINGKTPFSGLVYPSVRTDKASLNFVLNHQGMEHVSLQNVQWIKRLPNNRISGLDIATSWSDEGELKWEGRPANFVLKSGEKAKITKVGEDVWDYETEDGSLPWYS